MLKRAITLIILCSLITAPLSGCYDAREIDELTYVLAIGIDKGAASQWRLTVQFPALKESGGEAGGSSSTGGSKEEYETITVEAPTFFTGLNMINSSVPRELNFMHTNYLIISKELAESGEIGEYLAPLVRYRQVRRILNVIVSRTTAEDFIKEIKPTVGVSMPKTMQLMIDQAHNTGFLVHISLNDFYNGLKSTYKQPYAALGGINHFNSLENIVPKDSGKVKTGGEYKAGEVPRKGGTKAELFGSAIFDDGKMVAELDGDETRLMQIITGDFKRGFFTIPDPKKPELPIPLDVRMSRRPKVKVSFEDGRPFINVKIRLEGDLLAVQSKINYEDEKLKPILEKAFEVYAKNGVDALVEKCKGLHVDVLNFGRVAVRQFGTIEEWEKYNWLGEFKNAEFTSEVQFDIRRTGSMLKSSPLVSSEGEEW